MREQKRWKPQSGRALPCRVTKTSSCAFLVFVTLVWPGLRKRRLRDVYSQQPAGQDPRHPQIGSYISGIIGPGFAFTHGWQVALIYAIFVIVAQAGVDGQILAPRILGKSVGLHPIISVLALLIGTDLFGLLGALFAAPAAGIPQTFVRAFWQIWRERHPDQFPEEEVQKQQPVEVAGHDQPTVSTS